MPDARSARKPRYASIGLPGAPFAVIERACRSRTEPAMSAATDLRASRLCVILNPAAGGYTAGLVHNALDRHLSPREASCHLHEAAGHENLAELARTAVERGFDVVVAAGGDGTV